MKGVVQRLKVNCFQTMKTSVRVFALVPKRSMIVAAMEIGLNAMFMKMCVGQHNVQV